jgi:cyclic beta-1,2-glucan synthetase
MMNQIATNLEPQALLERETRARLASAAAIATRWDVVLRPTDLGGFSAQIREARQGLLRLESELARHPVPPVSEVPAEVAYRAGLLELGANHRLLRAALNAVSDRPRQIGALPRVQVSERPQEPRVEALARLYLDAVDGAFSGPSFDAFIRSVQSHEPLIFEELWDLSSFLKFVLLERLIEQTQEMLQSKRQEPAAALIEHIKSLRTVTNTDWQYLTEPLIAFDEILKRDPAGAFTQMDFETRQMYRRRLAVVARRSDCTELQVAQAALDLALEGVTAPPASDPRVQRRRIHIGYYLIDQGFQRLSERVGFHPTLTFRARAFVCTHGEDFFLGGIQVLTLLFMAAVLFPIVPVMERFTGLVVTILLLILPATQDAVDLINNAITSFIDPEPLPKLDFSRGIPADCTTLVAVPSLLLNEKQVRELVNDLEVRFLANREPNLHFALLTDLPDSVSKPRENDSHPLVELAVRLINDLNARYSSPRSGGFVFLHRHRIFNSRQGVWMGWERKRGKLLDLNKYLAGEYDPFPIKAGRIDVLHSVRYIVTLDSDTQLPHSSAARLAGAIAHPLNQAVIDPRTRIVTAGYGILQPRVGVTVSSAARSRLAAIYSGQNGFDIYSRAVSDAYQDLFSEGIFTGKGIYEAATLHAVLDRRFPRNSLLSHDLIEGAYARAGLATDIELIDDYPSHYSAYSRRKHRWVRGDWQIAQWMFSKVPNEAGRPGPNPISAISRWKIFDNLRRSLVDPFLFLLLVFGWLVLPGGPLYWTFAGLFLLFFPTIAQFAFGLGRAFASRQKGRVSEAVAGFWRAMLVAFLHLVFLPHDTLLAFDAIVRSLVRRWITGERLLEWETAYQSELQRTRRTPIDRYLAFMPLITVIVGGVVLAFSVRHNAILCAMPILLLWALANPVTIWLNRPPIERREIASSDKEFLKEHALRIWRYFHQFGVERHNFLIPDNVEETDLLEAARVSPTNIGLLLNARQAACEFGFITAPEFAELSRASLATITRLEKYRGHLYNWYDTHTLEVLGNPAFISSVDSGNFVASLYTLHAGAMDVARKPLLGPELFSGLKIFWRILQKEKHLVDSLARLSTPSASANLTEWIAWLPGAEEALQRACAAMPGEEHERWWLAEMHRRVDAVLKLLRDYLPWALPEFAGLRSLEILELSESSSSLPIKDALAFTEALSGHLLRIQGMANQDMVERAEQLRLLLPNAMHNLRSLFVTLSAVEQDAGRLAEETDFSFLVNSERQILSIGYEREASAIHSACYDMIASEARIATFLAIARGDLSHLSWYKLSRDHTHAYGRFLLLSWTGTMFEYLMPSLWMRSYPGTMIARTQDAAVYVQQSFARELRIPWGISESGAARKNPEGRYHYQAFGVPRIALWFEATAGPVVSPYSTFLALNVDTGAALENLRHMSSAGWVGDYGFYEAADYIENPRKPELVREWMAHHQGMSLLAITNLLRDDIVQKWFHSNALIQAAEMLLHEMAISNAALKARLEQLAPLHAA